MTVGELKEYIFQNEKIEYVLNNLGCWKIMYSANSNTYTACHKDGDNPKGVVITNDQYLKYISYSRNVTNEDHKDLVSLVEEYKGMTFAEAVKYLHKLFGLSYTWKKKVKIKKIEHPCAVFEQYYIPEKYDVEEIKTLDEAKNLDIYIPILHIDWLREGIFFTTAKKFGLAYSYKYHRVIIPCRYWLTGELVGVNMRTTIENYDLFGIKKYYITPSYKKRLNLYGLWENYKSITKYKRLTVFEAEKSVLKRDSLLDDTCVALQGKTISHEQVQIILGLGLRELTIALDNDVNINEVRFICEYFWRAIPTYYIKDKWGILGKKDSPADTRSAKYDFLYNHKVHYDETEHNLYLKSINRK